jgi:hypothetical protein
MLGREVPRAHLACVIIRTLSHTLLTVTSTGTVPVRLSVARGLFRRLLRDVIRD